MQGECHHAWCLHLSDPETRVSPCPPPRETWATGIFSRLQMISAIQRSRRGHLGELVRGERHSYVWPTDRNTLSRKRRRHESIPGIHQSHYSRETVLVLFWVCRARLVRSVCVRERGASWGHSRRGMLRRPRGIAHHTRTR